MRDVERDLLERGELGEVHLARLDAEEVRVLARLRTERRHDLRRHREEAMAVQPETVSRGAEDPFETWSGVTVGVQRAGELEHEPDGERIGLAEIQLGRRLEDVVGQGTLRCDSRGESRPAAGVDSHCSRSRCRRAPSRPNVVRERRLKEPH